MKSRDGFTLIEFMIVAAILVILAAIAVPMYMGYMERARNGSAQMFLKQMADAQKDYQTRSGEFVTDLQADYNGRNGLQQLINDRFKPDGNIGIRVKQPMKGEGENTIPLTGFVAFAAHSANGSHVYVYDSSKGNVDKLTPENAAGFGASINRGELVVYEWKDEALTSPAGTATLAFDENYLITGKTPTGQAVAN